MAGANAKDIKNRIRSMESTRQITKAMEMVASSKLRRVQSRALNARPYFQTLYQAYTEIAAKHDCTGTPFFKEREVRKVCYVVIAGDRGLAGGYNAGVLRLACEGMQGAEEITVLPIGKKAVEYFKGHGYRLMTETYAEAAGLTMGDCFTVANLLAKGFRDGTYDQVCVVYTNFISVLSQSPANLQLLPIPKAGAGEEDKPAGRRGLVLYEPGYEAVLNTIIPEYLGGVLYGALCESLASEQGARRTAMEAATKNAGEMIEDLSLKYNRARQGAITQEITEIVAGSDA